MEIFRSWQVTFDEAEAGETWPEIDHKYKAGSMTVDKVTVNLYEGRTDDGPRVGRVKLSGRRLLKGGGLGASDSEEIYTSEIRPDSWVSRAVEIAIKATGR